MSEQVYAYRALCSHGKVRFMAVDRPEMAQDNAREVAKMMRAGLTIDRVTVEEARKSDMNCPACDEAWTGKKRARKTR